MPQLDRGGKKCYTMGRFERLLGRFARFKRLQKNSPARKGEASSFRSIVVGMHLSMQRYLWKPQFSRILPTQRVWQRSPSRPSRSKYRPSFAGCFSSRPRDVATARSTVAVTTTVPASASRPNRIHGAHQRAPHFLLFL